MPDPITLTKAVTSLVTPKYWVKVIMIGFGIAILVFAGVGVNFVFNPKPTTKNEAEQITNNHYEIKPLLGGCATVKEARK